jgi:hypothetical protein
MKPLVSATESQISVAVGRCNKTVKIEVERNSAHHEKKKTVSIIVVKSCVISLYLYIFLTTEIRMHKARNKKEG